MTRKENLLVLTVATTYVGGMLIGLPALGFVLDTALTFLGI